MCEITDMETGVHSLTLVFLPCPQFAIIFSKNIFMNVGPWRDKIGHLGGEFRKGYKAL